MKKPSTRLLKLGAAGVVAVITLSVAGFAVAAGGGDGANGAGAARSGAPRTVGQVGTDNHFTPVTPCRLVDTRVAGGKLSAGSTRNFVKSGSLVGQGGNGAGCGVPAYATALEFNVTAAVAEGNGYLRLWPSGQAEPTATFMNYSNHFNVSNAGTVSMSGAGFTAKAYAKATHLIIDVLGYYTAPLFAYFSSAGVLRQSSGVTGFTRTGTGHYVITFNRNIRACVATASSATFSSNHDPSPDTDFNADPTKLDVGVVDSGNAAVDSWTMVQVSC